MRSRKPSTISTLNLSGNHNGSTLNLSSVNNDPKQIPIFLDSPPKKNHKFKVDNLEEPKHYAFIAEKLSSTVTREFELAGFKEVTGIEKLIKIDPEKVTVSQPITFNAHLSPPRISHVVIDKQENLSDYSTFARKALDEDIKKYSGLLDIAPNAPKLNLEKDIPWHALSEEKKIEINTTVDPRIYIAEAPDSTIETTRSVLEILSDNAVDAGKHFVGAAKGFGKGLWDLTWIIREGYAFASDAQVLTDYAEQEKHGKKLNITAAEADDAQHRMNQRVETIKHVSTEVTSFFYDTAVIAAAHLPTAQMGALSTQDFDTVHMMREAIDINPDLYNESVTRMQERGQSLGKTIDQFNQLEGPEKTEVIARVATNFAGPGILAKGAKTIYAHRKNFFPRLEGQNVLFKNRYPNEEIPPESSVHFLTLDEIRDRSSFYDRFAGKGESVTFKWAIDEYGNLTIASKLKKGVEYRGSYKEHHASGETIPHSALLKKGRPARYTGDSGLKRTRQENVEISWIDNNGGHHRTGGPRMIEEIEEAFIDFGVTKSEIRGKVRDKFPDYKRPLPPLVQMPPASDFVPSISDMAAGARVGAVSGIRSMHAEQSSESEYKETKKQEDSFLNSVSGAISQGIFSIGSGIASAIVGDAYAEQKAQKNNIGSRIIFEDFDENYRAAKIMDSETLMNSMGGKVKENSVYNGGTFGNTCTLRLSKALNDAGHHIPQSEKTVSYREKGKERRAFYRVKDIKDYLTESWGHPELITQKNSQSHIDRKGIMIVLWPEGSSVSASGHATYGSISEGLNGIEHYTPGSKLFFWELPTNQPTLDNQKFSYK